MAKQKQELHPLQRELNRRQRMLDKLAGERKELSDKFAAMDLVLARKMAVQRTFVDALKKAVET